MDESVPPTGIRMVQAAYAKGLIDWNPIDHPKEVNDPKWNAWKFNHAAEADALRDEVETRAGNLRLAAIFLGKLAREKFGSTDQTAMGWLRIVFTMEQSWGSYDGIYGIKDPKKRQPYYDAIVKLKKLCNGQ
jgi:hypothetical protein